jgi:hypothetical protein
MIGSSYTKIVIVDQYLTSCTHLLIIRISDEALLVKVLFTGLFNEVLDSHDSCVSLFMLFTDARSNTFGCTVLDIERSLPIASGRLTLNAVDDQ